MLGSRFDLDGVIDGLASRDASAAEVSFVELEREIAVLAKKVHSSRSRVSFRCPVCDDPMQVRDECSLAEFDSLDVKLHKLECDTCGMLTGRVFHPTVGYHTHLIR